MDGCLRYRITGLWISNSLAGSVFVDAPSPAQARAMAIQHGLVPEDVALVDRRSADALRPGGSPAPACGAAEPDPVAPDGSGIGPITGR